MAKITLHPLLVTPKGVKKPVRARENVYSAFRQSRQFFHNQLGQTFDLGGPISVTLLETWEQIIARRTPAEINGGNIWRDAFTECLNRGKLPANPLSLSKAYYVVYLRPPAPRQYLDGFGGMIGLEDWRTPNGTPEERAAVARPGMACVADEKSWLLCGKTKAELFADGWDLPWFGAEHFQAVGACTHEIVHIVSDLPHGDAPGTITQGWWLGPDLLGRGNLSPEEREAIIATGMLG